MGGHQIFENSHSEQKDSKSHGWFMREIGQTSGNITQHEKRFHSLYKGMRCMDSAHTLREHACFLGYTRYGWKRRAFLQRGEKTEQQRVGLVFFLIIISFMFQEMEWEKQGSPFFHPQLEKCTCPWPVEKRGSKRLCAKLPEASCEQSAAAEPVELFLMHGSVQQEQHNAPRHLITMLPGNSRDATSKLLFPPRNCVFIKCTDRITGKNTCNLCNLSNTQLYRKRDLEKNIKINLSRITIMNFAFFASYPLQLLPRFSTSVKHTENKCSAS